jgi:predicted transposase YbfD/YdcC
MCGAQSWNDVEDYGNSKKEWLSDLLDLPNGIPSHDTFNRFFQLLDPSDFEECFIRWTQSIVGELKRENISIDGKSMRGSRAGHFQKAVHIVSAYAGNHNLVLGQVKTDEKSNEITAIPQLLDLLDIKGNTISIDAMGTQTAIAEQIVEKEADYVLALKDNQGKLLDDALSSFSIQQPEEVYTEYFEGHGRMETRTCSIISNLNYIESKEKWANIRCIARVESERTIKSTAEVQNDVRFYISTLDSAEQIAKAVRSHWAIENSLHWILDVAFREDTSEKRAGNAAQNYALINKICLNLIKKNDRKIGVKRKRNVAGWDNNFLMEILCF